MQLQSTSFSFALRVLTRFGVNSLLLYIDVCCQVVQDI